MNIEKMINKWAYICESQCEDENGLVKESLKGDQIKCGDIADSFKDMYSRYKRRLIQAILVNDKGYITKDYDISDGCVNFNITKNADLRGDIVNDIASIGDLISVLEKNADCVCKVNGNNVTELDYDVDDTYGEWIPMMTTTEIQKENCETVEKKDTEVTNESSKLYFRNLIDAKEFIEENIFKPINRINFIN